MTRIVIVSKRWRNIVENKYFWIKKSILDGKSIEIEAKQLNEKNIFIAKRLYFSNPFRINLIKNPCGHMGLKYWCFTLKSHQIESNKELLRYTKDLYNYYLKNYETDENLTEIRNYWQVESSDNDIKMFATSYIEGTKFQIIDLKSEGLDYQLIKAIRPKIRISETYCARRDCGSRYKLVVRLLDDKFRILKELYREDKIQQWSDGELRKIDFELKDYSNALRYIFYYHHGCDTQFWAGYYGIKITNSTVQVII